MTESRTYVVVVAVACLVLVPQLARADHRFGCYKFDTHSIYFFNGGVGDNWSVIQEAIKTDGTSYENNTVLDLPQVGSYGTSNQVNAFADDYGDTGWFGLAEYGFGGGCWMSYGTARLNLYYEGLGTRNDKKYVIAHEVGHLVGMEHSGDPTSVMNTGLYGQNLYFPNGHDRDLLNTIYCPSCPIVALQGNNGLFVAAEYGGGDVLIANRSSIGSWEQFKLHHQGGAYYALQAANGQFVVAESGGGSWVLANRNLIGSWETILAVDLGGGYYGLRVNNGQYWTVNPGIGGVITATANSIGAWETFRAY